ncbi:hypothetical protein AAF712_007369 [Marasmius tenuissimus]|uniref:F-box domain-containing protein n=1 Tax=Marasmius tenuissimus TaxID=585030 RepID=A0ABR2ZVH8_9AGAR
MSTRFTSLLSSQNLIPTYVHHSSTRASIRNYPAHGSGPISTLPPELLLRIFFRLRPDHSYESRITRTTLAFTQVCQTWRSLALSTAKLWSTIDLCTRSQQYTEVCFSRSLSGEADISIAATKPKAFESSAQAAGSSSLANARNRIRKLEAALYPSSMNKLFRFAIGDDVKKGVGAESAGQTVEASDSVELTFENLTHLDLAVRYPFPSTTGNFDLSFLRIPAIQILSLDGVELGWASIIYDVQNRQRYLPTNLKLSLFRVHIEPNDLLALIQLSSEVFLEDVVVPDISDWQDSKVCPPDLEEITIISQSQVFVDAFLSILSLPMTTRVAKRVRNVSHVQFDFLGAQAGNWLGGFGGWHSMEALGA